MEDCIDIRDYNSSILIIIKQPGSVRHNVSSEAIEKVEMTVAEARELNAQLTQKLALIPLSK